MNQIVNIVACMKEFYKRGIFLLLLSIVVHNSSGQNAPKYEFRGVWVATVENIDWPSKPGLSTKEQQTEVIEILDNLQALNMNAVILQIRPASDAFYPSALEPWSQYLSGVPGKAPSPYYDPLEFWIEESHKRGLEFHAWMNPYRVAQNANVPIAANHIAFKHPEWIVKYGNKLYFDPAIPEVRDFVSDVVKDVVLRYDIDAIHFDDYFYPYPLAEEFPDSISFQAYRDTFSLDNKAAWRRDNVDLIVSQLHNTIKKTKPWVKFGISPFGVWRNKKDDPMGSETNGGLTNYDHLHADIVKWLKNDWIDYVVPQLYWRIGHPAVDYTILASWWSQNANNKSLYIGNGIYKIDPKATIPEWTDSRQLPNQIKINRANPAISGNVFYSYKHLQRDLLGFQDSLKQHIYSFPSIIPVNEMNNIKKPQLPGQFKKRGKKLKWAEVAPVINAPRKNRYIIYKSEKGKPFNPDDPSTIYIITGTSKIKLKKENRKRKEYEIRISTLDRLNIESNISVPILIKL